MHKYTTISNEDGTFKLSALLIDDGGYDLPSLTLSYDGEIAEIWDNEKYLIEELYPYLKGEKEDKELDEMFSESKEELLEIFEEGFKIGIFGFVSDNFKEGDWAAYNWLDEDGNDNWKIGRIVKIENKLMYFNDDTTDRCGYIPITSGVKLLKNG